MTDDELEAVRERLGRRVHHVTPDHEAALALLAEVDRLREESRRYRAAVSEHLHRRMQDVLGEYDAAQEHRREAAEMRAAERDAATWRDRWEALATGVLEHVGPWEGCGLPAAVESMRREAAEDMRRRAVEVLDAEHEYDAAALVEALPTSTEAPDGG